jgi:DNA anti-recombination protein RmuC
VAGAALNRKAADAVVKAIDGRFSEIGGQIDRRLAELEVKVRIELGTLDAQDRALAAGVQTQLDELRGEIGQAIARERQGIDADMRALRAQMAVIHKEFAETLARLVDEQIDKTVANRLRAVEGKWRETVREEVRQSGQERQIARLRERVESQEGKLRGLATALGRPAPERMPPA